MKIHCVYVRFRLFFAAWFPFPLVRRLQSQMQICGMGCASSSWGSAQKSNLHQIRLIYVFQCDSLFADGSRQCFNSHRTAVIKLYQCFQHSSVIGIQTDFIYFQTVQTNFSGLICNDTVTDKSAQSPAHALTCGLQYVVFLWNGKQSPMLRLPQWGFLKSARCG